MPIEIRHLNSQINTSIYITAFKNIKWFKFIFTTQTRIRTVNKWKFIRRYQKINGSVQHRIWIDLNCFNVEAIILKDFNNFA